MSINIIIPAHNEATVIGRCLSNILDHGCNDGINVWVVCNGCTDATAEVARSVSGVQVIETEVASKTHALNWGDEAAGDDYPRFYVDADVVISAESMAAMAQVLESGKAMAVAPTVQHDLVGASWAVRAFYDIDGRLPSRKEGIGGSGVYGMSEEGRKRFGEFPQITADDGFVRLHFAPGERMTVPEAFSIVTPPKTLAGVIAIKTRSHFGNYEMAQKYPELLKNRGGASNRPVILNLGFRPWLWARLAMYCYVKLVARFRARERIRKAVYVWERDETSRQKVGVQAHV